MVRWTDSEQIRRAPLVALPVCEIMEHRSEKTLFLNLQSGLECIRARSFRRYALKAAMNLAFERVLHFDESSISHCELLAVG